MKKNHPHAPAIWHNGNQNAGIRVWNKWVGQFDKENPETWAEEVCLNLYQWYDLGYKDKSMSENCDSYKFDPDGSRGYVTAYENRRRFKRRITGPHCREDEKLVRIFGADSGKYVDIGVIGKTVEFLTSIFRRK